METDMEIRQWAFEQSSGSNLKYRLENAQKLVDFVTDTNDAEVARAARELADKVTGGS